MCRLDTFIEFTKFTKVEQKCQMGPLQSARQTTGTWVMGGGGGTDQHQIRVGVGAVSQRDVGAKDLSLDPVSHMFNSYFRTTSSHEERTEYN